MILTIFWRVFRSNSTWPHKTATHCSCVATKHNGTACRHILKYIVEVAGFWFLWRLSCGRWVVCGARDVNVKLWQVTGAPRTHWFLLCRVLSYIFLSIISRESRSINFKDVLLLFASDVFMTSSKISQSSMSTVWNIHRFSREISSVLGNLFQAQMKCWEGKISCSLNFLSYYAVKRAMMLYIDLI